jgi:hypothetical protein
VDRPDSLELMRLLLARQRDRGVPFEQAWERALTALPRSANDRAGVVSALAETQLDWRLAYERQPPREPPGRVAARRIEKLLAERDRARGSSPRRRVAA